MQISKQQFNLLISTYNIRNLQGTLHPIDRYNERRDLLKKTILEQQSDIMGLQEVSFIGNNQIDYLIENDTIYNQFHAETQLKFHYLPGIDPEAKLDGNTFIFKKSLSDKLKVADNKVLHLCGLRIAQALKIQQIDHEKNYFWIVNTHLHHLIPDWSIRYYQLQSIHLWLHAITTDFNASNVIFIGDFNLNPSEATYSYIIDKMGFTSSYFQINKKEPEHTFPTGLQAPRMDTDPPGCFDYIWYKGKQITLEKIDIFGHKPLETDPTIYPSDHMGLTAQFHFDFESSEEKEEKKEQQ